MTGSPEGSKTFHLYYNRDEPKPVLNQYQMKLLIENMPIFLAMLPDKCLTKMEDKIGEMVQLNEAYELWGDYIAKETSS